MTLENGNPGALAGATGAEIDAAKHLGQEYTGGSIEASTCAPDLDMASLFLATLDPKATSWTFQTFDDSKRTDQSLARVYHGTLERHGAALLDMQARGAGVFVTVNETDGTGRKAKNVIRVRAFFLDLDGAPLEPVTAWEPPHILCETSPQKYHAYWLVDDCPLDAFKPTQKDLIACFGGDDVIHDLPRVMRLPGFWHLKGDPCMVRMIETGAFPATFSLSEFQSKISAIKPEPKLSERATPSQALRSLTGTTEATTDEVLDLLSYILPDCGYGDWLAVLMGLHDKYAGSQAGLDIADSWSAKGSKYVPGEVARKWAGFEIGKGTSWATVPALARANGADLSAIGSIHRPRCTMPSTIAPSDQQTTVDAPDPDAPEPRRFEELLKAAQELVPGQIDDLEAIVTEAAPLNPIRQDLIFRAIKDATNMPLGAIRAQLSQDTKTSPEPDHLDLARMTLGTIGRENVICAGVFVWRWQDRGVWTKQGDRAIKQAVQGRLENVPSVKLVAPLVNGVADVLKSEIYQPDHEFNRGNPESVNCLNGELELQGGSWILQPHCRENYRTTQIPVAYDQQADAPLFRAFLEQVFRIRTHKYA